MIKRIICTSAALILCAGCVGRAAEVSVRDGVITASGVPDGGTLITAVYRGGELEAVRLYEGSGTITAEPEKDIEELGDTDMIRVYLWDMDTVKPIEDYIETNAGELTGESGGEVYTVKVNGQEFRLELENSAAAERFREMLPMTVQMSELNGNEKYYYMDEQLPTDSVRPGTINEGDLMLYGSDCLVLFYETFQSGYSYTRLGRVTDPEGLSEALGTGSVTVTFE